jgi:hypothetical protein
MCAATSGTTDVVGLHIREWLSKLLLAAFIVSGLLVLLAQLFDAFRGLRPHGDARETPLEWRSPHGCTGGADRAARFFAPWGVTVDHEGSVHVTHSIDDLIRKTFGGASVVE